MYRALDVYVVASRQEGGPKGVLESLASGIPLVSTRVGQAPDIVEQGVTGLLVDVEDADGLAEAVVRIHDEAELTRALARNGRAAAEGYAYPRLDPLWASLLRGFVERG